MDGGDGRTETVSVINAADAHGTQSCMRTRGGDGCLQAREGLRRS